MFAYTAGMGGERASKTRMRERGSICLDCDRWMDMGFWPGGRRVCSVCEEAKKKSFTRKHIVTMHYRRAEHGYSVAFVWPGGQANRIYESSEMLHITLTRARANLADHQAVDAAIESDKPGRVELQLTEEQFAKLKG